MIGNGLGSGTIVLPADDAIYQALDTLGTGLGSISQNIDGSSTPVEFFIQPPVNEKYRLKRMNIHAIDGNWNDAANYGALGTALPVGIRVYKKNDSGIIKEYTSNFKIKRSHDWALLAGADSTNIGGSGADPLIIRWTFASGYSDIMLDGSKNERLVILISDNLTGLTDQISVVQGGRTVLL